MSRYLVTGGLGFIGSALCLKLLEDPGVHVTAVDKMTYAANPETLKALSRHARFDHVQADICDIEAMQQLVNAVEPDAIFHLAAETHVDRAIDGAGVFIQTNLIGTYSLLQAARGYFDTLTGENADSFRFLHISTDEVFGSLGETGYFTEQSLYDPSSPYSASKAGSDHLVRAWHRTYGLPVNISNCSNNYGPRQFPEKLIPLMILNALEIKALPVYGDGLNVRDWLHVEDHADALIRILQAGVPGETYAVGGNCERTNIQIVRAICAELDKKIPVRAPHDRLIKFVSDRPGHDRRYAIDAHKISSELGWSPKRDFERELAETIDWYCSNEAWWRLVRDGVYAGERLGTTGVGAR